MRATLYRAAQGGILVLALASSLATSAADVSCPGGEADYPCRAEQGDTAAMYIVGREAYEQARQSGDFAEALRWARALSTQGQKNGERLLKMTYIQLGSGGHKDYVQAYLWLSEAAAGGADYLDHWRKRLLEKMSPEQAVEARRLAGG